MEIVKLIKLFQTGFFCRQTFIRCCLVFDGLDFIYTCLKVRLYNDLVVTLFGTSCLIHRSAVGVSKQTCVN